ncbi:sigma-70 family RNA polymerase sigma factor [Dactylosporangium aurantiacum]|uniref:Sigma-70 family RNA polymerase sigma factor n=1 Tax=Dactylosporangium aurantiacum TaxID=35754 RepID=A0A9Q9IRQ0_9ACTN|nr:sigma-70 family RNA polymerase sigma factor [Dactylosporangium aurantiacum]MDG6110314.1 sigma-70 family RNA polymerase sigma factor [Dactylosporangium aurantiacum]UWZ58567.1 sigma-70 family RNA polymerase sigma factor [Dactylosporangium aurantiacum]
MNTDRLDRRDSPQVRSAVCACGDPECRATFGELAAADARSVGMIRNRLVERHLRLAYSIAARYRSDPRAQDIRQVAALALIEAVDRFDPRRGTPFSSFATSTVAGTLKRYLRDNRWTLRTPRAAGELLLRMSAVTEELTQRLRRDPRDPELAVALQCSEADITAVRRVTHEQHMLSLDGPTTVWGADCTVGDTVTDGVDLLAGADERAALHAELGRLPEQQLRIVTLYYFADLTQRELAEQIGVSQMQVSRLLRAALQQLRAGMLCEPTVTTAGGHESGVTDDNTPERGGQPHGTGDAGGRAASDPVPGRRPSAASVRRPGRSRGRAAVTRDRNRGPGVHRTEQTHCVGYMAHIGPGRPGHARQSGCASQAAPGHARAPHRPVSRPPPALRYGGMRHSAGKTVRPTGTAGVSDCAAATWRGESPTVRTAADGRLHGPAWQAPWPSRCTG